MQKHQSSSKTCTPPVVSLLDIEFIRMTGPTNYAKCCTLPFCACFPSYLLKRHLNNEKVRQIKGRSTKIAAAFIQYKANFKNIKISVSSFQTSKYEILTAGSGKNQTQFKANSKPIYERLKMNANAFSQMDYEDISHWSGKKTNPIQTQYKPNFCIIGSVYCL